MKTTLILAVVVSVIAIFSVGCNSEKIKSEEIKIEPAKAAPVVLAYDTPVTDTINPGQPPQPVILPGSDFAPVEPVKLFDNFYWVGSKSVGAFVVDTGDGLIILDTGWGLSTTAGGKIDTAQMVDDIKQLGLDPSEIRLILISHEHIDHYGGVQYLKSSVCPNAKVAMNLIGWNNLSARPRELAWADPRPESVDIFLSDGQNIIMGNTTIQVVYTPGHSIGCLSFIIPVKDNNTHHVIGIMGGTGAPGIWSDSILAYQSIDYFAGFTRQAKCDVGLGFHAGSYFADFDTLRVRKPGEENPLVLGADNFDTVYLQRYRDRVLARMKSLPPDRVFPTPAPDPTTTK